MPNMAEVLKCVTFEARSNYIGFIRAFQGRLDLTNKKMAELLDLPERTFCRFMAGESIGHEFDLIMRVYELSGAMMYQATGAKVPREVENSQIYSQLDPPFQRIADKTMRALWEEQREYKRRDP